MQKSVLLFSLMIGALMLSAQKNNELLRGQVTEQTAEGEEVPIIGANIYWLGTLKGTVTGSNGHFEIPIIPNTHWIVISYVGFISDTIQTTADKDIQVRMRSSLALETVEIGARKRTTEFSYVNPIKVEKIDGKELLKAACCNLSESFETSPSVDVSYTDAITGTRQIQMLGLAGPYTQITTENMPDIRGLSSIYGLTYIPGTWVEGIQLNKGTGTVVNGFESVAGQINVELKKSTADEKLILNLYGNESGRTEGNVIFNNQFERNWSNGVLLHGTYNPFEHDRNNDGFMDHPQGHSFIGMNRWKHSNDRGLRLQLVAKATYIKKIGGQLAFSHGSPNHNHDKPSFWGMYTKTNRWEGWAKLGKVFEKKPWKSIGSQIKFSYHDQITELGLNTSNAQQASYYYNVAYQSILNNTNHSFQTGSSLQADVYTESLNSVSYDRTEIVPGAFFEYTFKHLEKVTLVTGFRGDFHNHYGFFVTPKIHARYAPNDNLVFRIGGGRGQRTANIIAENIGVLASSREIIIEGDESEKPYGLMAEVAWNVGLNMTRSFTWGYRNGAISLDFYRTDFQNQIVVDLDQNPQEAHFYNLSGKSYSNSFQVQFDYELVTRLDVRMAYRWFDVRTTIDGSLLNKPLLAKHRAFLNAAYETRNHWKFDATVNWQGEKRIPNTALNPEKFRLKDRSPSFVLANCQISKTWHEKFDVYVGVENLLNYSQQNPILSSDNPFGDYFDSSLIWGPVFGRNIYGGIRYRLKK